MFLKKHFSKLEPKVKKISAGVLSVAMVAGAIFAGTSMKAGAKSKTQDVLNELLGAAKPYGLVAEEFKNSNHNQTNFAVNTLHVTDQWLSAWQDKSVGTTYVRDFDNLFSSYMRVDTNAFNNLVLGSDFDYDAKENMYYIKNSDGVRTGAVVDVRNCRDVINVFYDRDYIDVTAAREYVAETFKKYAQTSDENADIVIKADDRKVIDLAGFSNKQIVVVNMYARNNAEGNISEFYSLNDNFQIKNKADGQFIIINMLGAEGDCVSFNRLNINGKGTGGLTDVDISDTVIFNAVNFNGNIEIAEQCGVIVAPYADVKLINTCNGRVIAKTFENVSGQLHFISDAQEEETTGKETVSESEPSEPAKSEDAEVTKPTNPSEPSVSEDTKPAKSEDAEVTKPTNPSEPSVSEDTKPAKSEDTKVTEPTNPSEPSVSEDTKPAKSEDTKVTEPTNPSEPSVSEDTKPAKSEDTKVTEPTNPSEPSVSEDTKPAKSEDTKVTEPTNPSEPVVSEDTEDTKPTQPVKSDNAEVTKPTQPSVSDSTGMKKTAIDSDNNNKKGQVAADEDYAAGGKNVKSSSDSSEVKTDSSKMDSDSSVKSGKTAEVGADEDLVQTGDNKHIGIYIGILVAAVIVSGIVIVVNRKKSDK